MVQCVCQECKGNKIVDLDCKFRKKQNEDEKNYPDQTIGETVNAIMTIDDLSELTRANYASRIRIVFQVVYGGFNQRIREGNMWRNKNVYDFLSNIDGVKKAVYEQYKNENTQASVWAAITCCIKRLNLVKKGLDQNVYDEYDRLMRDYFDKFNKEEITQ